MKDGCPVTGVLLAGGLGRRMGGDGDKPLKSLGGRAILDLVVERARPQVDALVLNVNGDARRFDSYELPVAADVVEGYAGPLAGILTGMEWSRRDVPDARWMVSFATDAPFFPSDMVSRLIGEVEKSGAEMACAQSRGRTHPVFALWPIGLADDLRCAMLDEDMRKIDRWTARYHILHVDFDGPEQDAEPAIDPFFNINRPEDLIEAENWLREHPVQEQQKTSAVS